MLIILESGTTCAMEGGKPICKEGTLGCMYPGYKPRTGQECCSGQKDGAYCKGLAAAATCDATKEKTCDVGLVCLAGVCTAQLAKGANCKEKTTLCQNSEYCNATSFLCTPFYTLAMGDPSTSPAFCSTGWIMGGKCDKPGAKTDGTFWYPTSQAKADLCKYASHTEPGTCSSGSAQQSKAVNCKDYTGWNIDSIIAYAKGYKENSCMAGDIGCDKNVDNYGCSKAKSVAKDGAKYTLELEKYNEASCMGTPVQTALDKNFQCFGAELAMGVLSVLAFIALLI
jgi:hypothetical protein